MKITALIAGSAIAALTAALAAGLATAQTAAPPAKPRPHRDAQPGAQAGKAGHMHAPTFDDLDTNHDGVVSKAEFEAFRAAHPMPGHPQGDEGRRDEGMRGEGMRGEGPMGGWGGFKMRREMMWMRMREMQHMHGRSGPHFDLEAADTDHDGKVSWAEFQTAVTAKLKDHFDRLDKNHDEFIDKSELPGHGMRRHHDDKDNKAGTPPVK